MRKAIILSLVLIAAVAFVLVLPVLAIEPGDLSTAHEDINDNCLSCHSLATGVSSDKCLDCHNLAEITVSSSFHQYLEENDCMECHALHADKRSQVSESEFSHESLIYSFLQNNCTLCHEGMMPSDSIHQFPSENCSSCHSTSGWSDAKYAHDSLLQSNCISCHQETIPSDSIHDSTSENCSACHSTSGWSNADFEHIWFTFDRHHPATCSNCHTIANDYSQYTCYNCHEHSASEIKHEHLEEGISNYENCVSCHQSGSEHATTYGSDDNDDDHDDDREDDDHDD